MSKTNRPAVSLARLVSSAKFTDFFNNIFKSLNLILKTRKMKNESRNGKTAVVVGTITNDLRVFDVPKLSVR